MARTPALLVPNTPEGRFYNALPDFAARIANAVDPLIRRAAGDLKDLAGAPLFTGSKERLERLLLDSVNQFSFDDVKAYGVQNVAKLLTNLPIFPTDDAGELVDFAAGKTPLEVLARRLPNGTYRFPAATAYALLGRIWLRDGAYRYIDEYGGAPKIFFDATYGVTFSEEIAYWMTADPPVGLFGLDAVQKIMSQLLANFDKENSSGAAWQALGAQVLLRKIAEDFIKRTNLQDINQLSVRDGFAEIPVQRGEEFIVESTPVSEFFNPQTGEVYWNPYWLNSFFVASYGEGEGITEAVLDYDGTVYRLRTVGRATGLKAFLSSPLFKIVSIGLAIWGIGAALASISTGGATFLNVAQLTASVDNLPGVDLGVVGDVAKGLSFGINAASGIPGAESMFDFEPGSFDLPEFDTGVFDIPVIDPGLLEVSLTLEDIGAGVIDFDTSIFADFGLEATDLIPDDFGNIFTVTGEAVVLDPETYVKTIYLDEGGNYRDYTNRIIQSQAENEQIFNETGADEPVFRSLAAKAQALAGNSFVAEAGPDGRPAGTPAPAARGEVPFFQVVSEQVMGWFKTITSYSLAKEQLEKTGRYTPPYQTNPNGTAYSQVPGVPVRRADGSTVVNNGNGTQTIQYPNGQVQTVPTNLNPGSFSNSQFGGGGALIPGISNQTLLIAGAGLLAVALLARRT